MVGASAPSSFFIMKWTKEQFLEATKSLYRMKSLMYKVEHKYNFKTKDRRVDARIWIIIVHGNLKENLIHLKGK